MRATTVLTTLGLAAASLLATTPTAAAAPHPDGPALMLISQDTAKCVGLPDSTALNRGVPGLALVRLNQIPVPASRDTVGDCLDKAAKDPNNPVKNLADKFGVLLGLTPQLPKPELHPVAGSRAAPGDDGPPLALLDTQLNKRCIGSPIETVQGMIALVNAAAQDILSSDQNQECTENSTKTQGGQLTHILDDLPILSGSGVYNP
ncbi:rodlin [Streptomyces sp. NPDC050147]|uniref:rodlin n=1 Tax=Streptomyces sp. NPDC050147 TaxID=3155513 RepID=UPI0034283284